LVSSKEKKKEIPLVNECDKDRSVVQNSADSVSVASIVISEIDTSIVN
jgi:hypothetical protein